MALVIARRMREERATGRGGRHRPPAEDWTVSTELLASMLDRLGEMEALLADLPIAGKKRKAKPPKRYARPETAIERADQMLAEEHVQDIIADVEAAYMTADQYAAVVAEHERYRQASTDQPAS